MKEKLLDQGAILSRSGSLLSYSQLRSWVVPAECSPLRLDAFLRRCLPHLSLREIRKAIDGAEVLVNHRKGKKGQILFAGDAISIHASSPLLEKGPLPNSTLKVEILHEDEAILVVDKPAGMATHGTSGKDTETLANFLVALYPFLRRVGKNLWEPGLVHRLDRETSGIVLIAKDTVSFADLRSQFRRGVVQKKYWALVYGTTERQGIVDYPLIHDPKDRRKMSPITEEDRRKKRSKKWQASTRFRTLGQSEGLSLLEIQMETGVTHQIRVHLEAVGHPLVGDPLYGGERPSLFGLKRQFLHAFYLSFHHPQSGQETTFTSPLPNELGRILDHLKIKL